MKKVINGIKYFFKRRLDVRRAKNFDIIGHLALYHFFYISTENDTFYVLQKDNRKALVLINKKQQYIELIYRSKLQSRFNFIPESPIVADVFMNLSMKNLK